MLQPLDNPRPWKLRRFTGEVKRPVSRGIGQGQAQQGLPRHGRRKGGAGASEAGDATVVHAS
jgi:hypothetical protein